MLAGNRPWAVRRGNRLGTGHLEARRQELLRRLSGALVVVHQVKGVVLRVLRVDAISRKAADQAVAALVHVFNAAHDQAAVRQ